jgi:hypothetical protein
VAAFSKALKKSVVSAASATVAAFAFALLLDGGIDFEVDRDGKGDGARGHFAGGAIFSAGAMPKSVAKGSGSWSVAAVAA